jgi:hypothetical protein
VDEILQKLFFTIATVSLFLPGYLPPSALADTDSIQDSQIIISTRLKDVSESDIARVRKEAVKGLESIPPVLGFEYKKKIKIEIVADGICRTTPDGHLILLPIWHIQNRRAAIIHEVSHAIVRRHEDNSFFSEGLAEFFQAEFGEDIAGAAYHEEPLYLSLDDLVIKHRDNLISLSSLKNNNDFFMPIDPGKRKLPYIEAGSFITFLYEVHGGQKLQGLYNTRTLNYEKIYGKKFTELEAEWLKYVLSHDRQQQQQKPLGAYGRAE